MLSNSSRCTQESVYKSWTWCLYNDHCLDIVIIIWSSVNCLTVICLPAVCYFSREQPLVKPMAPGSSFSYICLCDLFLFAFIFRSINPKIQKYLAAHYFVLHLFKIYLSNLSYFYSVNSTISGPVTREGSTTPFTRQVASICSLCSGTIYIVLLGSPTSSITLVSYVNEIPTAAVLHHPFLFGKIPT